MIFNASYVQVPMLEINITYIYILVDDDDLIKVKLIILIYY